MAGMVATQLSIPDFSAAPEAAPGNASRKGGGQNSGRPDPAAPSQYDEVARKQTAPRPPADSRPGRSSETAAQAGEELTDEPGPEAGLVTAAAEGETVPEPVVQEFQLMPDSGLWAPGGPGQAIQLAALPGAGGEGDLLLASRETFAALLQTGGDLADGRLTDMLNTAVPARIAAGADAAALAQGVAGELRPGDPAMLRGYATSVVDVPVGASEWGERIMGKLSWLAAKNFSVAEIHITPPELGPLEVRVQVQNDQATVTVHATTQAVREQLESQSVRLREMLAEQGLNLEGFDVSDSGAEDSSADPRETAAWQDGRGPDREPVTEEPGQPQSLDLSWKGQVDLYI